MSHANAELPVGTLTFLFTDIEGSTRLWEQHPEAMRLALERHDHVMRDAIEANDGHVFKTIGDAFCAVFVAASDALRAALVAQEQMQDVIVPTTNRPLAVRMALHTGVAESRNADYFGPVLNRVARLMAVGHGGQILVSDATKGLIRNVLPPQVVLSDLGLHSLKDLPQPERIHQVVRPGTTVEFPPLRSIDAHVHNLPQQLNAFIGRDPEVETWREALLRPQHRLYTMTGFAGIGKTRMAMHLAESLLPFFPDGVWWCEQEHSRTAEDLYRRLAEQLKLNLQAERTVAEQIHHFLRDRNLLLVLDNLEQIENAAQVVRELLQAGAGVKILVTSRRALDLRGETLLELTPMPLQAAVALFEERAQSLRPNFKLTPESRPDVETLCKKLEGVPLAIELAATRIIAMTPRQIRQRLSERFRLLQSKSPDLSPRQRALHSAIEWSYCLLQDEEKQVFAQLSVFVGGFSLEDAEAVCEGWDVLESVLELRKHSFFSTETDPQTQQNRFMMLESLREYAAEQLKVEGEAYRAVHRRHVEYFVRFAREQNSKYRTAEEIEAVRQLEQQSGNLTAALDWADRESETALYAEIALLSGHYLLRRGFQREAVAIVQQGLERLLPLKAEHPALTEELLREQAGLYLDAGDLTEARRLSQEALALATQLGNAVAQARSENLLGQIAKEEKDYALARLHYGRGLAYAEPTGATTVLGQLYNNLALVERNDASGDAEEVVLRRNSVTLYLQKALKLRQAANDRRGMAEVYINLGVQAYDNERYEQAWNFYALALQLNHLIRNGKQCGIALFNMAEVALKLDQYETALPLLLASERLLEEALFPYLSVVTDLLQGVVSASPTQNAIDQLRSHQKLLPLEAMVADLLRSIVIPRTSVT